MLELLGKVEIIPIEELFDGKRKAVGDLENPPARSGLQTFLVIGHRVKARIGDIRQRLKAI